MINLLVSAIVIKPIYFLMTGTRISVFLQKMFRITNCEFLVENKSMPLLLKVSLHYTALLLTVSLSEYKNDILHYSEVHLTSGQLLVNPVPCVAKWQDRNRRTYFQFITIDKYHHKISINNSQSITHYRTDFSLDTNTTSVI